MTGANFAVRHGYSPSIFRLAFVAARSSDRVVHTVFGVFAASAGVFAASLVIGIITTFIHVSNISLLYLVVVIVLALTLGRGAASLGAVLAFFADDFFFIPPEHQLVVNNPAEWVSLAALLLTGLVVGQLAAEVRQRERIAVASQQRIALLYTLAQDIAERSDHDQLLKLLTQRIVDVFAPLGVSEVALWLPSGATPLTVQASTHTPSAVIHQLDAPDHLEQATAAFRERRVTSLVDRTGRDAPLTCFVPLSSGGKIVGILSVSGPPSMTGLLSRLQVPLPTNGAWTSMAQLAAQADLFAAFRDQVSLAIERAALQQEAINATALRASDRLKNALLGSVTHDLRTPIAAIQTSASTLLQTDVAWTAAEEHEILTTITTSADRLARLVDNLLVLSKLESGTAAPRLQPYPINDVVATVLDQLDRAGVLAGRDVQVLIAEDPLEAPMDHTQIERVVMNLVENAIKYSPPGSPIVLRASRTEDAVEVAITDQGVGIPTSQQEAIFDKFFRLQQPTPWTHVSAPQGTGLGLAICAGIIREHRGRLGVVSQAGQGATFSFTLPLVPRQEHELVSQVNSR